MSEKLGRIDPPKGKVTYCFACKDFTETILSRDRGPIPGFPRLLSSIRRTCKNCAKIKIATEIETDENSPLRRKEKRDPGY